MLLQSLLTPFWSARLWGPRSSLHWMIFKAPSGLPLSETANHTCLKCAVRAKETAVQWALVAEGQMVSDRRCLCIQGLAQYKTIFSLFLRQKQFESQTSTREAREKEELGSGTPQKTGSRAKVPTAEDSMQHTLPLTKPASVHTSHIPTVFCESQATVRRVYAGNPILTWISHSRAWISMPGFCLPWKCVLFACAVTCGIRGHLSITH